MVVYKTLTNLNFNMVPKHVASLMPSIVHVNHLLDPIYKGNPSTMVKHSLELEYCCQNTIIIMGTNAFG
jgi:hypothetical protein